MVAMAKEEEKVVKMNTRPKNKRNATVIPPPRKSVSASSDMDPTDTATRRKKNKRIYATMDQ
ncbi:hypothetical protein CR513_62393, partial [Mucuna pruriens]